MKKNLIYLGMAATMLIAAVKESSAQTDWHITGNAGTSGGSNFIGTTDNVPLKIRTNNKNRVTVSNKGYVGIGTTAPVHRLEVVGGTAVADNVPVINSLVKFVGAEDVAAIYGESQPNPGFGIGVDGFGNFLGVNGFGAIGVAGSSAGADTTAANTGTLVGVQGTVDVAHLGVGVYGEATNCFQNIGVWGRSIDTANFLTKTFANFAGYYQGDLYGWRVWQNSDERLKKDIQPVSKALDKVAQLNAVTYLYTHSSPIPLPGGTQIGFVAQQLEKVFPEVVKDASIPTELKRDSKGHIISTENVETKIVNYMGLIPVLAEAIKEQKAIVDAKDAQIADLNARLTALETRLNETSSAKLSSVSVVGASLEQNNPNPFNQSTQIRYTVPANYSSAQLIITSVDGKAVRTYTLSGSGKGQVTLNASELAVGSYTYTLNIDGKVVDSKNLVLTK